MPKKKPETLSEKRRRANLSRKTFSGGTGGPREGAGRKPDPTKPRCPCGANSATRAAARAYDCCKKAGVIRKARG